MTISFLCLYYLLKYWRRNTSHWATTCFTLLIALYNIAVFAVQVIAGVTDIGNAFCPMAPFYRPNVLPDAVYWIVEDADLIPTFLIITDTFLVSAILKYSLLRCPLVGLSAHYSERCIGRG